MIFLNIIILFIQTPMPHVPFSLYLFRPVITLNSKFKNKVDAPTYVQAIACTTRKNAVQISLEMLTDFRRKFRFQLKC